MIYFVQCYEFYPWKWQNIALRNIIDFYLSKSFTQKKLKNYETYYRRSGVLFSNKCFKYYKQCCQIGPRLIKPNLDHFLIWTYACSKSRPMSSNQTITSPLEDSFWALQDIQSIVKCMFKSSNFQRSFFHFLVKSGLSSVNLDI